jgi:uncharacterized protein YciI
MYILLLTYLKPIEVIDQVVDRHRAWLKGHYDAGHFLISGAQEPRMGGVIIAKVEGGRSAVEAIIADDPFLTEGAASYEIIEFIPRWTSPELAFLKP